MSFFGSGFKEMNWSVYFYISHFKICLFFLSLSSVHIPGSIFVSFCKHFYLGLDLLVLISCVSLLFE